MAGTLTNSGHDRMAAGAAPAAAAAAAAVSHLPRKRPPAAALYGRTAALYCR